MTISAVVQQGRQGGLVQLFRLDTTSVGGQVLYFCTGAHEDGDVSFGGVLYTPVDVEFSDMETNGNGSLPQPKMKLSNTNSVIQDIINTFGDLLGCELRRVRTFARFLDNGSEPDPTSFFGPDVFRVERKTSENPVFVEWELSAAIDQEGKMIPGRVLIRDTCVKRYRYWDSKALAFVYPTANPCPYTGSAYFTNLGAPTDAAHDSCGRRVSDCKLRFPNQSLPFGGFPGAARVST